VSTYICTPRQYLRKNGHSFGNTVIGYHTHNRHEAWKLIFPAYIGRATSPMSSACAPSFSWPSQCNWCQGPRQSSGMWSIAPFEPTNRFLNSSSKLSWRFWRASSLNHTVNRSEYLSTRYTYATWVFLDLPSADEPVLHPICLHGREPLCLVAPELALPKWNCFSEW